MSNKNYITPQGIKTLRDELLQLTTKIRPEVTATVAWAASLGDRSENADYTYGKKKLRQIDSRIRYLTKTIDSAEVIDPSSIQVDHVTFGATVRILDEQEQEQSYSLVGSAEINTDKGHISWLSPLGQALLKKKVGDLVSFKTPKGEREIEIIEILYVALSP